MRVSVMVPGHACCVGHRENKIDKQTLTLERKEGLTRVAHEYNTLKLKNGCLKRTQECNKYVRAYKEM
jgi:hypothetical protein